jgi:hypothetical protein
MTAKERFAMIGYTMVSESENFVSFSKKLDTQQTNFVNVDKKNHEFCILADVEEDKMPVYVDADVLIALTQLFKELGI